MKKPKNVSRTKMLMLLSLMFLSIAVLCMGVLAAESATYNIAGNISYNMVDYVARINTRVYKVADEKINSSLHLEYDKDRTKLYGMSFEKIERSTDPYYVLSQKLDTGAVTRTSDTTTNITGNINIEYGATDSSVEYYRYYVVINIKEVTGEYVIDAQLEGVASTETSFVYVGEYGQTGVKRDETRNLVIAFGLKDGTESSEESFEWTLKIDAYKQTSATFGSTKIYTDEGISYWYVDLGKTSEGAHIRWRLVSKDGTSKYENDASTAPSYSDLAGKAVFFQQTWLGKKQYTIFSGSGGSTSYGYNNYYGSTVRTTVNNLDTWALTSSGVSSLIKKRNITGIEAYSVDGEFMYTGTTDDYFWLLSEDEIDTFLGTTAEDRQWSGTYWTRTPNASDDYKVYTCDGSYSAWFAGFASGAYIRAGFLLA